MVGFEINISQDLFSILKFSFFSLFQTKELEKRQTNKKPTNIQTHKKMQQQQPKKIPCKQSQVKILVSRLS